MWSWTRNRSQWAFYLFEFFYVFFKFAFMDALISNIWVFPTKEQNVWIQVIKLSSVKSFSAIFDDCLVGRTLMCLFNFDKNRHKGGDMFTVIYHLSHVVSRVFRSLQDAFLYTLQRYKLKASGCQECRNSVVETRSGSMESWTWMNVRRSTRSSCC